MKVIDNFLTPPEADLLENVFLKNNDEIWNFVYNRPYPYFVHLLYKLPHDDDYKISPLFKYMQPILLKLNRMKFLVRAKANLYLQKDSVQVQDMHTDFPFDCNAGCYFVNSNNGYLSFEDGTKIDAKKGRVVLFNGFTKHAAAYCSDEKSRVTINFNYVENIVYKDLS